MFIIIYVDTVYFIYVDSLYIFKWFRIFIYFGFIVERNRIFLDKKYIISKEYVV